jgi:CRISPR system Cascade subunit CasE
MFFSRIELSPAAQGRPAYWRIFDDPYRVHQAVWALFADDPDRRRDFLYRIDLRGGRPLVHALSRREPVDASGMWEVKVKSYAPDIRAGDRLSFALRANPTRCREGKRHDVVMDAKTRLAESGLPREAWPPMAELAQRECGAWIETRAEGLGLKIESVRVDGMAVAEFRKRGAGRVRITTADFAGRLAVVDAARFKDTLITGVGRAKGFGCGLLLCARA